MKKYPLKKTVHLVELSDVFRRHAAFDRKDDAARQLVKATRRIASLATYYRPEYPQGGMNAEVDARLKSEIRHLAALAQKFKIKEVILPFEKDQSNWIMRRIQNNVVDCLSLPVAVLFQEREYNRDMSSFGRIDRRIKTVLDIGLRGVAGINDKLKTQWDLQPPRP